ncbi:hypothetical protein HDU91_001598, partial [Kappamyces sp. JEL0680]
NSPGVGIRQREPTTSWNSEEESGMLAEGSEKSLRDNSGLSPHSLDGVFVGRLDGDAAPPASKSPAREPAAGIAPDARGPVSTLDTTSASTGNTKSSSHIGRPPKCPHGRGRSSCIECNPSLTSSKIPCPHGKRKYYCLACGGGGMCEHAKRRVTCRICNNTLGEVRPYKKKNQSESVSPSVN